MCRTALALGTNTISRNTVWWSVTHLPLPVQDEIHGRLDVGGRRYGWSYRDMDWYVLEDYVWDTVHAPPTICH